MSATTNVLVVENDPGRIVCFKERFAPYPRVQVDYARSAEEARAFLDAKGLNFYDFISLDHDLTPEASQWYVFDETTGSGVARYIVKLWNLAATHNYDLTVVLHSTNDCGLISMIEILAPSEVLFYIRPYVWIEEVFCNIFALEELVGETVCALP